MKKFFELQLFAKTIKLTAKADTYENNTKSVKILALGGNDSIENFGDDVTIVGGAGNDTIYDLGDDCVIDGGAGNDSIHGGNFSTITGGKGNDTISAYGKSSVIKYASGDGNDVIEGFHSGDTLYITKGSYSTMVSGSDFIVKVGKQTITLDYAVANDYDKVIIKDSSGAVHVYNDWKVMNGTSGDDFLDNAANNVTVNGGAGDDYISNYGSDVNISCGAGNDTVYSFGKNSTVSGGAGDDTLKTSSSNNVTVSGGDGKDYIDTYGNNCIVDGGAGNDTIDGWFLADDLTVSGGKGNDYIDLGDENNVVKYASGDGKDVVNYFRSDDILHITKGSYKVKTSGSDVIVTVGKGSITLKDAAGVEISIKDSKGNVTTKTYGSSSENVADLLEENNFATADNISELVESKFAVGEFETFGKEKTFGNENLITFAK